MKLPLVEPFGAAYARAAFNPEAAPPPQLQPVGSALELAVRCLEPKDVAGVLELGGCFLIGLGRALVKAGAAIAPPAVPAPQGPSRRPKKATRRPAPKARRKRRGAS